MIYTVTFNPAIDYIISVNDIKMGNVNRSQGEYILYGGKGINVSIVLNNLGIKSKALGFVAGFTGLEIEGGLKRLGVDTDFVHVENGMSRINVKIKSDSETEVNGQGPEISKDNIEELLDKLSDIKDGDYLVLAGSIPKSVPNDIYEKIMERFYERDIRIIVDATKELLLNILKYKPFLIKPNNYELGEIFGVECKSEEDIIMYEIKLQEMGARNVLISRAGDGAILLTETKETYITSPPKGTVVNSVGAGDSMIAGFIADYIKNKDYESALKYATATGSATAFSEGLAEKNKVEELLK